MQSLQTLSQCVVIQDRVRVQQDDVIMRGVLVTNIVGPAKADVLWRRDEFVTTPAPENQYLWKTRRLLRCCLGERQREGCYGQWYDLLTRVIPSLVFVARGQLRLVGVSPRSADELEDLPKPWRDMLLAAQTGLISESLIQFGPDAPTDPRSVADLWHSSAPRRLVRAILLGRYLRTLILGPQQKICGAPLKTRDSFVQSQPDTGITGASAISEGGR